jgi:hypothetical protein
MTFDQIEKDKERIEREYDELIAQLNEAQAALSDKASKVNVLGPGEYRLWLANAKSAVQRIQADIAVKKVERSEARRAFNGWVIEGWLNEPDCDGWWWFFGRTYDTDDAEIETVEALNVEIEPNGQLVIDGCDSEPLKKYRGKWKFLPMPDLP